VASLAAAQFHLLREIFDLARRQRASLEQDSIEEVVALMEEREAILDQLQQLAEEAAEPPSNVVPLPGAEDYARQDAIALDTVIRGILEHDRGNEELLVEKMQAIRDELPRLRRGRQASAGYRGSPAWEQTGGYADRVS
jgi:tRNA/tmRNA/rRNA uracil-C5-methylase (TrmA/RlmC/RlmD family)